MIGLTVLGIDRVFCSPLHVGSGTIQCAHGTLPVPAPATAELIKGKPVYSTGVQGELLTPTGAAILTTLSSGFGPMPAMAVQQFGYGAGTKDPGIPNLLRVAIGEARDDTGDYAVEQTVLIETTIDDMNPQLRADEEESSRHPLVGDLPVRCGGQVFGYSHAGDHHHRAALAGRQSHHGQTVN